MQELCILPTQYINILYDSQKKISNDYYSKQHQPVVLCNGDAVCILRRRIEFPVNKMMISGSVLLFAGLHLGDPATRHRSTDFLLFRLVFKQMLRWF
jgi:hypothetical protein